MKENVVPEFSRLVGVEDLAESEKRIVIEASSGERRALANRFDLVSMDILAVDYRLLPVSGGSLVRIEGHLVADVVQRCVVSLDPVPAHIGRTFTETFAPEGYRAPDGGEDAQIPETLDADGIDLGEVAAQILLLSLDPYPRAADYAAAGPAAAGEDAANLRKPFAALGEMIGKRRK